MQTELVRRLASIKKEATAFYKECEEQHGRTNWMLVRPMAVLYLAYLLWYDLAICLRMGNVTQSLTLMVAIVVHACLILFILSFRDRTPGHKTVNRVVSFFGYEILAVSGFLGIAAFPDEVAFLFPLMLIMMTQIYTRSPVYAVTGNLAASAIFLFCDAFCKDRLVFMLDAVSVFIALGIAFVAQFTLMMHDLQCYHSEQALKKMCSLDPMTQLNNKTTFQYLVEEYLHNNTAAQDAVCVILDLDDFKGVNDKYGHQMGDEVLKAFSAKMHALTDTDDNILAGRFGGDEFVLFYKRAASMERVLDDVRRLLHTEGFSFEVSCCAGIAALRGADEPFADFFRHADESVYKAKSKAHGNMVVYH